MYSVTGYWGWRKGRKHQQSLTATDLFFSSETLRHRVSVLAVPVLSTLPTPVTALEAQRLLGRTEGSEPAFAAAAETRACDFSQVLVNPRRVSSCLTQQQDVVLPLLPQTVRRQLCAV